MVSMNHKIIGRGVRYFLNYDNAFMNEVQSKLRKMSGDMDEQYGVNTGIEMQGTIEMEMQFQKLKGDLQKKIGKDEQNGESQSGAASGRLSEGILQVLESEQRAKRK